MQEQSEAAVTYQSYLQLDKLLTLQTPLSQGPEHDEMLFIVIHQVYELWFKEMLHELDHVTALFRSDRPHRAQHTLKRILTILKVMVAQLDILETMTPLEFLSFRARLEAASGFQSNQFRQIEFLLGAKNESALARFTEGSPGRIELERRFLAPTLWDALPSLPGKREISRAHWSPDSRLLAAGRADAGNPADPARCVSERHEERGDLRAARGPRRRHRRVEIPSRQDGGADDRRKPGTGGSRGAAYLHRRSGEICFPICGRSARGCSTLLAEMLDEVVGEDVHLLFVYRRAIFHHRDDDVPPLFAVVVAAELRHFAEVVTARARGHEDLLPLTVWKSSSGPAARVPDGAERIADRQTPPHRCQRPEVETRVPWP